MPTEMSAAECAERLEKTSRFVVTFSGKRDELGPSEFYAALSTAAEIMRKFDRGELVEVVQGEWSHIGGDDWCCTKCGYVIAIEVYNGDELPQLCPNCGAKMDGERKSIVFDFDQSRINSHESEADEP